MDIRQLRYFIAIAEQGTISKAAEHLHMAQPPLSRQLKMMEDELGVVLFDRNKKKKVTLTAQGELFLKKAKKLLHGMEEAILEVKEFSEEISGTLSVGSTIYCAPILLSNLKEFRQKYSHIKFNIWEGDSTHLMNLLKNRQIDIAITGGPFSQKDIEMKKLEVDPCVLVVPNDYNLAEKVISIQKISEIPLLLLRPTEGTGLFDQIINVFQKLNLTPNILCECHDSAMLLNLVEMGFGATILPLSMINQKLMKEFKIISIQDNPWISEPALVWRANSYLSASTREFLRLFNN
ncbi:LysR family transcriptional regulator [Priestia megaterium]|jgi:DNA-binding transcriptional LysR family regulator|uniref:LysR family transcriptional regulator n=3 Tax=Priestia megaterium TaxID=1404 RepID=A0AAE5P223_PRIMG|nr:MULTISPECIES: LysR family transcriptional regulator [Priestia]KOP70017.1 LysR family transcriptional regulator [Bacillus sp. FJAT-21351]MCJ7983476.1 LysR family transcriptional regulator [Priestia sp. OVL9]KAA8757156.1 LysR family transcriptional regulator [Priestia megaterium]MBD8114540.1 LysR family transcriptional regulator [Priestia megaterium]MCG0050493.1 LysR family transcriptional regulator [Priestia aryabhattai]